MHFMQVCADPSSPDDIRAAGWVVAVHNDYRLNGEAHTFWLFTKDDQPGDPGYQLTGNGHGRFVRGEGKTDAEALEIVRLMIGLPARWAGGKYLGSNWACPGPHMPPACPHCIENGTGLPVHPEAKAEYDRRQAEAAAKLKQRWGG